MNDIEKLKGLVLAPYIIKATTLIGVRRKVGGNQFRHAFATLAILLDYKMFSDPILLKASVIHDLFEDCPQTNEQDIRNIDEHSNQVVDLVLEVTKSTKVTKAEYLKNILENGTVNAKILKVADRISNLTDLHRDNYPKSKMSRYLNETETYVLPMAKQVSKDMETELSDLVRTRRVLLSFLRYPGVLGNKQL